MPLQNRVTPFSKIVSSPARGLFMGNRGVLHDEERRLGRATWRNRRWIVCTLAPRGPARIPMTPGRYTELFFMDETTGLAAGHRPCAECRRGAFSRFAAALAGDEAEAPVPKATDIDRLLHAARLVGPRAQRTTEARTGDFPEGAMVRRGDAPWLVTGGRLLRWTLEGYDYSETISRSEVVTVLTPVTTLEALRNGYRPVLHPSAETHGSRAVL